MESTLPAGLRGRYQLPDSRMTLREGLEEYYRVNPGLSEPSLLDNPQAAAYFHNHDSTHVVFGTHTGPLHEGLNDLWTFFGVDIRARDYIGGFFATGEAGKIAKHYSVKTTAKVAWWSLRLMPALRRRARAMTKKWPWTPPAELMDRPLCEIRSEYGIDVCTPEDMLGLSPEPASVH